MTIASQTSRIAYTGDGATTAFAIPFYFGANADLVVVVQDAAGNITTKLLGTDYALTGATLSAGGTCTFTAAPTTGFKIAITRVPPITQTTSYNNNDPFPAKSHELALDKATTIDQYLKTQLDRTIMVAPTDNPPAATLPPASVRALKNFTFDSLGNPSVSTPVAGTTVSSAMIPVITASTLAIARAAFGVDGTANSYATRALAIAATIDASVQSIRIAGYTNAADGGGALYKRSVGPAAPDKFQSADGAWWKLAEPILLPQMFGAVGDGNADDTVAIQNAVNAAAGAPVFFPVGRYVISSAITSTTPINVFGVGMAAGPGAVLNTNCSQIFINSSSIDAFSVTSMYGSIFRDLQFNVTPAARPHTGRGIYLAGTAPNNVANYKIQNCGFSSVGTPIRALRPVWGAVDGCYFEAWRTNAIYFETSAGIEGGGGHVTRNYFFGQSTNGSPTIYSEVGYTIVHANEILGGNYGVQFNIKNNPAGFIKVTNNTIENFGTIGIGVLTGDGNTASMVMIDNNEFSCNANAVLASVLISDNVTTPSWVSNVTIRGNVSRNITQAGGRHIWVGAGKNVIVANNVIDELGANTPGGIHFAGASTNAGLVAPIQALDNSFIGTVTRYTGGLPYTIRDLTGIAFASIPVAVAGNGSQMFVTDGTQASNPLTGGSTGSMAFRQNGAWRGF